MFSGVSFPLTLILGFMLGIGFIFLILRFKKIEVERVDEKMLLLRLPLLGTVEAEEPKKYRGIFVKGISEIMTKIKDFQRLTDFNMMLSYACEYNLNYIGTEGDMDGAWSNGRLAYSTLSKGYDGGYNIYLNPDLDCESVCHRLNEQLNMEIKPDELYTFLFLHEIGHTRRAGNDCYITAMVNHSLSGGRRSAKRRRKLKDFYYKVEKYADNFAIQELLKLRQRGISQDARYECTST